MAAREIEVAIKGDTSKLEASIERFAGLAGGGHTDGGYRVDGEAAEIRDRSGRLVRLAAADNCTHVTFGQGEDARVERMNRADRRRAFGGSNAKRGAYGRVMRRVVVAMREEARAA